MKKRRGANKKILSDENVVYGLAILARAIALRYMKDSTGSGAQSIPVSRKADK